MTSKLRERREREGERERERGEIADREKRGRRDKVSVC
jgi:hypothetical protein